MLGLAFKPNTDDMREAASSVLARELIQLGMKVIAYDPIAIENAKKTQLPQQVIYANSSEEALKQSDFALIVTEWDEFKQMDLGKLQEWLTEPILFDGRNCFTLEQAKNAGIEYHSMGRPSIMLENKVSIN
ncbi:hypothetical protein GCM10020331_024570 [Ectobacillus funiculus]